MQISDASSIARFVPSRVHQQLTAPQQLKVQQQLKAPQQLQAPQQMKAPQASTPPPQAIGIGAQPQIAPKPVINNVLPTAITSPPVPDLGVIDAPAGGEPQVAESHKAPLDALFADWGKKDSEWDLDGDGTVGIKDMLQLLKEMSQDEVHKETDPLKALLADWGKTDSPHDLNGDGTVGIQDMLLLLAKLANDPVADPDGLHDPGNRRPDDSAGELQSQADRLKALLADWGTSDSKYDLDGDGTVGIQDMLALLKLMAQEVPQPNTGVETPGTPPEPGAPGPTVLEQLIADWGKKDSRFDLDGDGTVGIRDMLMLLAQMAKRQPEIGQASKPDSNGPEYFNRIKNDAAQYHRIAAQNYARSILPQLASMDPNEVRESVKDSDIPTEQKRFVLDQIAAWHPHGHEVSVVG